MYEGTIKVRFSSKMDLDELLEKYGEEVVKEGVVKLWNLENEVAELYMFDFEFEKELD